MNERELFSGSANFVARGCLVCGKTVTEWNQPYGWLHLTFGNGLLCGSGPCLERAIELTRDGESLV